MIPLDVGLLSQYKRTSLILTDTQQPMNRVRHIEHVRIVNEVKNHRELFARAFAHATTQLLHVDRLGHGGASHKQDLSMGGCPILHSASRRHIRPE